MPNTTRMARRSSPAGALLLLATIAFACSRGDAAGEAITMRDSSGVQVVTNDLTRLTRSCTVATEPSVSIGVEEGDEAYMLSQLGGAVRLSDGRIVLANRATDELRYFDASGKYLYTAGRKGEGPGEFREPFYLHVLPGDTVYAGDFRPFRFLVFGPDGKWVRTISLDPMEINTPSTMNVLRDGRPLLGITVLSSDPPGSFPLRMMSVRLYDRGGKVLDSLGRFPNGRYGVAKPNSLNYVTTPMFEAFAQVRAREDRIVAGHASKTELTVHGVTAGFPAERVIRWDPGSLEITPPEIAAERARVEASYSKMQPSQRQMFQQAIDADVGPERPIANRFPAFGQLRIGRDDRIWIREYPRPTDTSNKHHWIAFGRDGRFDCRLETPRFNEYLEFGADYLLVLDPDSTTDVERVRSFPLTRASGGR